ncbi:MAG: nicotinate-nucleotide adenylyltransferase [Synergistaceae bacterium]|jgi:nicotinate-nucleotide adenylyltransferase|nr:nicotinate-nucleotide adenylyltransferase [Synergistaceae bacterium]
MSGEKIGIMGGTFDPVHYGHLFAAEQARVVLSLGMVVFVPSGTPPHKSYPMMASAEDRYAMTELAIRGNDHFAISRAETDRPEASYTADTLEYFRRENPGAELFLITGADAALDIPNWHEPDRILSLCRVAVAARPGYVRDKITELSEAAGDSLIVLDTGLIDVSATEIRELAAGNGSIRYMTPDSVCRYIAEKKLYSCTGA